MIGVLIAFFASFTLAQICLNSTGYVEPNAALCVYCNLNGNLVNHECNCTQPGLSPTCTAM
jgi:hypothetical protein